MFEDEMTEEHEVRTDEEYRRLVEAEIHEEHVARMQGLARAMEGLAACAQMGI